MILKEQIYTTNHFTTSREKFIKKIGTHGKYKNKIVALLIQLTVYANNHTDHLRSKNAV